MDYFRIFFFVFEFALLILAAKLIGLFYTERKTTFKGMALSILGIYIAFCLQYLLVKQMAPSLLKADILIIFVQSFLITFNYKSSLIRRFGVALFTGAFSIISIIIIGGLIVPLLFPSLLVGSDEWSLVSDILFLMIGFIFAKSLQQFKSLKKKAFSSWITLISPLTGLLIALLIVAIPLTASFGIDIQKPASTIIVLLFIAWFLFSSFFMYDILSSKYEDKLQLYLQAKEKEYYYTQCQLMRDSVEQVRTVRHDMASHLAALKDYTANGNLDAIASYLDSLVSDMKKSEIYSDTGNIAFDSVINYKLQNAKKDDISLDINISVPPELKVEVVDIVSIIGNLLDNALDAVTKANEKRIRLDITFSKGILWTKIENSFNGEVKYEGDPQNSSITSLKSGNEHGYGLKNIKRSAEKYNGCMKISHTESVFSIGVFMYVGVG